MKLQQCPKCGFAKLPDTARCCPRCHTEISEDGNMAVASNVTRPTLVEEVRSSKFDNYVPTIAEPRARKPTEPHKARFRPLRRPPMAVVCVLDDGEEETGEEFRVRTDCFVIGRTEGDVVIPHDDAISSRHCELRRELADGRYRWLVNDLSSTNGTFARVDEAVLKHNQELILGSRHYRFDAAPQGAGKAKARGNPVRNRTLTWQADPDPNDEKLQPALIELASHGDGARRALPTTDVVIGSDPGQCGLVLTDDPFIGPREAQLTNDRFGRWILKTLNPTSGVWARIHRIEIVSTAQFQIGEQRVTVRIP